jgi:DMSO reductase anchor subunit
VDRRFPRFARGKGSLRRAVVAAAAVALALAALGFVIWVLVTRSAGKQAWLASLAAVVAVVLPAWG